MSELSRLGARFSLVSVLQQPNVHPDGTVDIDYYFSGVGTPTPNKLQVILPNQSIIDSGNIGNVESGYGYKRDDNGDYQLVGIDQADHRVNEELSIVGITTSLPDWFFEDIPPDYFEPEEEDSQEHGRPFPINDSEVKFDKDFGSGTESGESADFAPDDLGPAPLHIKLNLKSASPGDYQIKTVFVYDAGSTFWIERDSIKFHVASWPERHRFIVAIGTLLSGLAVLGVIIQILSAVSIV